MASPRSIRRTERPNRSIAAEREKLARAAEPPPPLSEPDAPPPEAPVPGRACAGVCLAACIRVFAGVCDARRGRTGATEAAAGKAAGERAGHAEQPARRGKAGAGCTVSGKAALAAIPAARQAAAGGEPPSKAVSQRRRRSGFGSAAVAAVDERARPCRVPGHS